MSAEKKLPARPLDHRLGSLIERIDASSRSVSETTRNPGLAGEEGYHSTDDDERSYRRRNRAIGTDEEGSFHGVRDCDG